MKWLMLKKNQNHYKYEEIIIFAAVSVYVYK